MSGWPKFQGELVSSFNNHNGTTTSPTVGTFMKPASTKFTLLKRHPSKPQSLVLCTPLTGRTHQIRKHLSILGYPIIGDTVYGESLFVELTRVVNNLSSSSSSRDLVEPLLLEKAKQIYLKLQHKIQTNTADQQLKDTCSVCDKQLFKDPEQSALMICLHALRYTQKPNVEKEDAGFMYETPLPVWAQF